MSNSNEKNVAGFKKNSKVSKASIIYFHETHCERCGFVSKGEVPTAVAAGETSVPTCGVCRNLHPWAINVTAWETMGSPSGYSPDRACSGFMVSRALKTETDVDTLYLRWLKGAGMVADVKEGAAWECRPSRPGFLYKHIGARRRRALADFIAERLVVSYPGLELADAKYFSRLYYETKAELKILATTDNIETYQDHLQGAPAALQAVAHRYLTSLSFYRNEKRLRQIHAVAMDALKIDGLSFSDLDYTNDLLERERSRAEAN